VKIEYTPAQQALQAEVKNYLRDIVTPELEAEKLNPEYFEGGGPVFREKMKKLGADGWISMSWPKDLGGQGASAIEQYIFTEEVIRSGFPYPFLSVDAVGPVLAANGNDHVRDTVVRRILSGEVTIAIGYSEPSAGTDLASLKTRAQPDGDHWLINGQKIWTSLGNFADYIWLAARTDPDASKKHKGLTMFLVPTDIEGFSVTPIHTLGTRTNATYYQDIRLPDSMRVGEVNKGWKLITGQLNRERLSLVNLGMVAQLYDETCRWAATTHTLDGRPLISESWVQHNLARVRAGMEALKLICWKQAWLIDQDALGMAEASMAKVYGTEFFVETYRLLLEITGQAGTLAAGSPGAVLQGKLEHRYRCGSILTFGGGTNEVQRDIIAAAGLWMPRSR